MSFFQWHRAVGQWVNPKVPMGGSGSQHQIYVNMSVFYVPSDIEEANRVSSTVLKHSKEIESS